MTHHPDRPDTHDIHRLLEHVHARENPITRDELRRFMELPSGPNLSRFCLEARKLPDDYGWRCEGEAMTSTFDEDGLERTPVLGLAVDPCGVPCILTTIDGMSTVIQGTTRYTLRRATRPNASSGWSVELLGFSEGLPVTVANFAYNVSDAQGEDQMRELNLKRETNFYFGGTNVCLEGVVSESLLSDGTVALTRLTSPAKHSEQECLRIRPDGMTLIKCFTRRSHGAFWLDPTSGKLIAQWETENGEDHIGWFLEDPWNLPMGAKIKDVMFYESHIYIVVTMQNTGTPWLRKLNKPEKSAHHGVELGSRPYIRDFQILGSSHAYIGNVRHQRRCYVIDKNPLPEAFDLLSRLFTRADGRLCYYGVLGRHLYLMQAPLKR